MMDNNGNAQRVSLKDLWKALEEEEQQSACQAFWENEDLQVELFDHVIDVIAKHTHSRPKIFKKRSLPEKTRYLKNFILSPALPDAMAACIRSWLLAYHREMVCSFLDSARIPHEDGLINEEPEPPEAQTYVASLETLLETYEPRIATVYIGYVLLSGGELWEPLGDAVRMLPLDFATHLAAPVDETEEATPEEAPQEALQKDAHTEAAPAAETQAKAESEGDTQKDSVQMDEAESAEGIDETKEPPRRTHFTTLDRLLIQTTVASALQMDHALSEEEVEGLVNETVNLNVERKHSYFHRGFFNALFGREMLFEFPGANAERRSWYFTGAFLGYLRGSDKQKCDSLLSRQKALIQELVANNYLGCGTMLLPHVYPFLLQRRNFDLLRQWINNHVFGLEPGKREAFLIQVYEDAAKMLRRGLSSEAGLLLETIANLLTRDNYLNRDFIQQYVPLVARKRGQALQLEGDFFGAQKLFTSALDELTREDAANTLADLGLIAGAFRSLRAILPSGNIDDAKGKVNSLARGKDYYGQAIDRHGDLATNAHFCMGILYAVGSDQCAESCSHHLQQALNGMLRKEEQYGDNGLIDWTRLLLGLALLETAEDENLQAAKEYIEPSLENQIKFPMWLWKRVLEALGLFDRTEVINSVAQRLFDKRKGQAFQTLWEAEFYSLAQLQLPFFRWIQNKKEAVSEKWGDLLRLFHAAKKEGAVELCEQILDYMEVGTQAETPCRELFIDFLENNPVLQPVWEESDINALLVRLYRQKGHYVKAAGKLQSMFYKCRDGGTMHQVQEAREIIETIRSFNIGEEHWRHLDQSLIALEEDSSQLQATDDTLKAGAAVRVVYIGGNETQEAYEDSIKSEIVKQYPGLKCTFLFPGWNTNWSKDLNAAKPHIDHADVVVINKLIRTQLGRALRKYCGSQHPWIACGGRGKQSIHNRIVQAAQWIISIK